jgi:hypothetical protein
MTSKTSKTARHQKATSGPMLSPKTRNTLLIGSGSVLVVVLAWWAYLNFTTIAPPNLAAAKAEDAPKVVDFLGSPRGMARMSVDQQEQYLVEAYRKFGQGPDREKFVDAMNQMSVGEREILQGAVFQIARKKVVAKAKQYSSLPPAQRAGFIDQQIREFEQFRGEVSGVASGGGGGKGGGAGAGGKAPDISQPLKADLPHSSDEMLKVVVSRTTAQERSQAQPYVDAMADRYKQMKGNDALKQKIIGG